MPMQIVIGYQNNFATGNICAQNNSLYSEHLIEKYTVYFTKFSQKNEKDLIVQNKFGKSSAICPLHYSCQNDQPCQ